MPGAANSARSMRSPLTSKKRLAILVLLVLVAFAMGACKRRQQVVRTTDTDTRVDRELGVTPRDTTVQVPAAQVSGTTPLPLSGSDLPPVTVRSDRAFSTVSVQGGLIKHSGGCDTTSIKARLYDRWSREQRSQQRTDTHVEQVTVEVTVIPTWVWWALAFGLAGLARLLWPLLRRFIF